MTNGIPNTTMVVNRNLSSTIRNYIKEHGEGKKISEKDVSIILRKMAEVNEARNKDNDPNNSIFKGGSKYAGGSGRTNFLVNQGQKIDFTASEYNKIFDGYLDKQLEQKEVCITGERRIKPILSPENGAKLEAKVELKDTRTDANIQMLKNTGMAKVKSRKVDGQKRDIAEIKDKDGNLLTRRLINADGTLGEELVQQTGGSLFGKATYVTRSKVDAQVREMLHLADNQSIPKGINSKYEQDANGNPQLVLTDANGNRLDSNTIKDLLAKNKELQNEKQQIQNTFTFEGIGQQTNIEDAKRVLTLKAAPENKPAETQRNYANEYAQAARQQVRTQVLNNHTEDVPKPPQLTSEELAKWGLNQEV